MRLERVQQLGGPAGARATSTTPDDFKKKKKKIRRGASRKTAAGILPGAPRMTWANLLLVWRLEEVEKEAVRQWRLPRAPAPYAALAAALKLACASGVRPRPHPGHPRPFSRSRCRLPQAGATGECSSTGPGCPSAAGSRPRSLREKPEDSISGEWMNYQCPGRTRTNSLVLPASWATASGNATKCLPLWISPKLRREETGACRQTTAAYAWEGSGSRAEEAASRDARTPSVVPAHLGALPSHDPQRLGPEGPWAGQAACPFLACAS